MKSIVSMLLAVVFLNACNSNSERQEAELKAKQTTIDSMRIVMEKQAVIDSMNAVMAEREQDRLQEEKQQIAENSYVSPAAAPKNKGWSHTAKGAVVGAGTGAITGAIVNKKRGEGALIGSLIGAGVGAGTGAIVDNSKKKKAKQ
jgi:hypothetical protein